MSKFGILIHFFCRTFRCESGGKLRDFFVFNIFEAFVLDEVLALSRTFSFFWQVLAKQCVPCLLLDNL